MNSLSNLLDRKEEVRKYAALPDDENIEPPGYKIESGTSVNAHGQPRKTSKTKIALRYVLVFLGYVLSIFILWLAHRHWTRPDHSFTDCGKTPDQARAAGCFYEGMQRAWVPPECYFPEPGNEEIYDIFHNRLWWQDLNLTVPADVDGLVSGDVELAYTRYWHDEHCAYVLRKMSLAVAMRKRMITSIVANTFHANHCAHFIANRVVHSYNDTWLEKDTTFTESYLVYETCVPLDVVASGPGLSPENATKWEHETG